jgi:hypothetical protein
MHEYDICIDALVWLVVCIWIPYLGNWVDWTHASIRVVPCPLGHDCCWLLICIDWVLWEVSSFYAELPEPTDNIIGGGVELLRWTPWAHGQYRGGKFWAFAQLSHGSMDFVLSCFGVEMCALSFIVWFYNPVICDIACAFWDAWGYGTGVPLRWVWLCGLCESVWQSWKRVW